MSMLIRWMLLVLAVRVSAEVTYLRDVAPPVRLVS
jgi:hypothetical protein